MTMLLLMLLSLSKDFLWAALTAICLLSSDRIFLRLAMVFFDFISPPMHNLSAVFLKTLGLNRHSGELVKNFSLKVKHGTT